MATIHLYQVLVVLWCTFCIFVHAGEVVMGRFHMTYGLTGCLKDPTRDCVDGKNGDTCYVDRGLGFAITGTAPLCNACMPFNHRNIATYQYPQNLPCALWRFYGCDDLFVTHVWYKSGSNSCFLGGRKSYNMNNWFVTAAGNEEKFIEQCRQEKSRAHYGLPPSTKIITEEKFCFPLRNNITILDQTRTMSSYKEYFEKKYMKN